MAETTTGIRSLIQIKDGEWTLEVERRDSDLCFEILGPDGEPSGLVNVNAFDFARAVTDLLNQ